MPAVAQRCGHDTRATEDYTALQWLTEFQAAGGTFHWFDEDQGVLFIGTPMHPPEALERITPVVRALTPAIRLDAIRIVKSDPARWVV